AFTEVLCANGARVTTIDRDGEALEAQASRLRKAGQEVTAATLDVADTPALRKAIEDTTRREGRLDIAFANAGMSAGPGYGTEAGQLDNVDPATWQRVLDVNLSSVFATLQAASKPMK